MQRKKAVKKIKKIVSKKVSKEKVKTYDRIRLIIETARNNISRAINREMVLAY